MTAVNSASTASAKNPEALLFKISLLAFTSMIKTLLENCNWMNGELQCCRCTVIVASQPGEDNWYLIFEIFDISLCWDFELWLYISWVKFPYLGVRNWCICIQIMHKNFTYLIFCFFKSRALTHTITLQYGYQPFNLNMNPYEHHF